MLKPPTRACKVDVIKNPSFQPLSPPASIISSMAAPTAMRAVPRANEAGQGGQNGELKLSNLSRMEAGA